MKVLIMLLRPYSFAFIAAFLCPTLATSHEFWIDPVEYQVEIGETVQAYTKNGQKFAGIDLAYFERRVKRFEQIDKTGSKPVPVRPGDSPAFAFPAEIDGLLTLIYRSSFSEVSYETYEDFDAFALHKAFKNMRARHIARNLPDENFKEVYTRFAKSLIGVGKAAGNDVSQQLETEFVALKNPYTDDLSNGLPVQLLYREKPRPNVQVEIFERAPQASKPVAVTTMTTDANGIAVIPVKPGHSYLLDGVVLRAPSAALADETGAVWETLWAALTFAVP